MSLLAFHSNYFCIVHCFWI